MLRLLALSGCVVAAALQAQIVVLGASGNIAGHVLQALRHEASVPVAALSRSDDVAYTGCDHFTYGTCDMSDPASVHAALRPYADRDLRVFLATANGPQQAELEVNVIKAVADLAANGGSAGRQFIVKLSTCSAVMADGGGEALYAAHVAAEAALAASGVPHVVLRPHFYMQ